MTGSNSAGQDEPCSSSSSETTQETKIHWERQTFYLLTRALMGDPLMGFDRDLKFDYHNRSAVLSLASSRCAGKTPEIVRQK